MSLNGKPIPDCSRVLVIGGGPAGSMAAMLLAREGVEVCLLERDKFPRYHIGESLLTSVVPLLKFVGIFDQIDTYGFVKKYGGFFRIKQGSPAGHVNFNRLSRYRYSYQVIRSEFDKLLLDHARNMGADVHEETSVTSLDFDGERPVAAHWKQEDGNSGRLRFDYVVDATGLSGLMATRYLKNRQFQEQFANVAVGGYWRGFREYRDDGGTEHAGAFSMEVLADGSGWTWAIPLHNGTLSVGIVVHRDTFQQMKSELGSNEAVYDRALSTCPDILRLLAHAKREGELRQWADYSYVADKMSGPGYRLAGDAAGFIDPLFSSGVHLAFLGGLSSAATICSELRGTCDEPAAIRFHERYIRRAYTRFVITVAGIYQQMRNQDEVVLHGVDRDSFQLAFDLIQPIVSGNVDLNRDDIPPDVMRKTMRYTSDLMLEMHSLPSGNPGAKLLGSRVPEEAVSEKMDAIDGLYIRMQRGRLGVARLTPLDAFLAKAKKRVLGAVLRFAGR